MDSPPVVPARVQVASRLAELGALVDSWTRAAVGREIQPPADRFGQMLEYHLGWRDENLRALAPAPPTGKMLRPALTLLVSEAVCGSVEAARASAVAVELVHNFSLVHDDIQDRSDLRRHRPTVWRLWGEEQAINVGDALFTLAHLVLARDGGARGARLLSALDAACLRLVEGQYLDLELQRDGQPLTLELYEAMITRKTGALFEAACRLGAIAAGADDVIEERFAAYGLQLGRAFQEQDDVLGVWGSVAETGKPDAADIRVRKKGLPAVLALTRSDAPAWLLAAYAPCAQPMEEPLVGKVIAHFERLGVREEVERRIERRHQATLAALDAAGGREPARSYLAAISEMLVARRT